MKITALHLSKDIYSVGECGVTNIESDVFFAGCFGIFVDGTLKHLINQDYVIQIDVKARK